MIDTDQDEEVVEMKGRVCNDKERDKRRENLRAAFVFFTLRLFLKISKLWYSSKEENTW